MNFKFKGLQRAASEFPFLQLAFVWMADTLHKTVFQRVQGDGPEGVLGAWSWVPCVSGPESAVNMAEAGVAGSETLLCLTGISLNPC
jgi:hypothetical protein